MGVLRLILVSLRYHWRMNLAVACGTAVGTAVLTGALLVGDSVRGSLRRLTLDRLGRIEQAMVGDRFFRAELANEIGRNSGDEAVSQFAAPVILLNASLETADRKPAGRANRVQLIGCDERFWQLGPDGPGRPPGRREIVLNRPLAEQLGVAVGDTVVLRLPRPGAVPAESLLGRKRETVRGQRLTVCDIIPAEGLGRFGLRPTQQLPRNAYVSLAGLQQQLDQPGRANAILTAGREPKGMRPRLADYGLRVSRAGQGRYFNITSDRMILDPAAERAILRGLKDCEVQPALTYLANTIACRGRTIPYSTITAMDFAQGSPLGPMLAADGKPVTALKDGEIALNSWAADDLGAKPGDTVRVSYFEPESTHGRVRERSADLRLAAVVQLAGAADDRALTPSVPGVTDQLSMANWDPPFPFDSSRVRPKDDRYWHDHRAVPKAFVSLATGQRLWGSRFGNMTSIRVRPAEGLTLESLKKRLTAAIGPAEMGFVFQPVREQGLAAAEGTTPFSILFLAFSSFIIIAAVMLVALLFRLGIDRRAAEAGMLLAVGFRRRQVAWLYAVEGLLVAAAGSLLGTAGGIGYAAAMLAGLRTWWLAAVGTPFLHLEIGRSRLVIGGIAGLLVAWAAIVWSARRMGRVPPRRLLAGQTTATSAWLCAGQGRRWQGWLEAVLLLAAIAPAIGLLALPGSKEVQAGAFFGAGAVALGLLLALAWLRLRHGATGPAVAAGRGNLARMALRNAARNPGRSALTMGLIAVACFLIVAVSAFHIDPARQAAGLHSGSGGFDVVAESDQPIYQDVNSNEGRTELGFSDKDNDLLAACTVISLRAKPGDDASCLNLYQPRQPRLLGVPPALVKRDGFAWAAAPMNLPNPWRLLQLSPLPEGEGASLVSPLPLGEGQRVRAARANPVPVILENNTAEYSLHLGGAPGATYDLTDARGRTLHLEVAALLADSIFQGDLLMSEQALLDYDPDVSGYRVFLIQTPPGKTAEVQSTLERTLGDYGLAAETTAQRLAGFLAVRNTYLSAFQSLGGLGLLLGTIGLAVVQLRNVLERRGELALLRAAGFRRAALARLVMLENAALLVAGLAVGTVAAAVAVLPHLAGRGAAPPWGLLAALLALVLAAGLLAGLAAVRAVLRTPLLAALREER